MLKGVILSEFEFYFEKMMNFYDCSTIKELAAKINTLPSTISNWNQRQSISALKKKCRELGIFGDIFSSSVQNNFQNANLSGSSVGVEIGSSHKTINNNQNDCGCDDELVKSLMRELCRKYKDDMDTLKTLLFQLTIQKS